MSRTGHGQGQGHGQGNEQATLPPAGPGGGGGGGGPSLMRRASRSSATTTFSMEVFDNEVVPSSLQSIAPILRVAAEIQAERPRVAYLCMCSNLYACMQIVLSLMVSTRTKVLML